MPSTRRIDKSRLPGRFDDLVSLFPPQAIMDEVQHENTVEMVDRLMAMGKLTQGQALYLETLVQLVEIFEEAHHGIETSDLSGVDALRHLMEENQMTATALARLLEIHSSMGSKILNGERALTVDHIKRLAARFKASPELFMA